MNNWWNKYIHLHFKDKGRDPAEGVDCWGFVRVIFQEEHGIILPSYTEMYEHTLDKDNISKNYYNEKDNIFRTLKEGEKPQEFDFIILKVRGLPMHCGLVTKPNFMLHCSKDIGVSHETYKGMRWNNKVLGFARYAG